MKLSELIINYRKKMQISQREFSRRCDLSNSYISFIENEKNPRTGKPMVPTLEQYKKIANCMGLTVQQLFEQLDEDAPVDLGPAAPVAPVVDQLPKHPEIRLLASKLDRLPKEQRDQALDVFNAMYHKYFDHLEDEKK